MSSVCSMLSEKHWKSWKHVMGRVICLSCGKRLLHQRRCIMSAVWTQLVFEQHCTLFHWCDIVGGAKKKTFWRKKFTVVYMNIEVCRWMICWETAPKKPACLFCLSSNVLEVQIIIFKDSQRYQITLYLECFWCTWALDNTDFQTNGKITC